MADQEGEKVRNGNFSYEMTFRDETFIVHRGVSQGGRELSPKKRTSFWRKNSQEVVGITINHGKVRISLEGLRGLSKKSFVIVSNPEKPRIWTSKRIIKSAKKVQMMTSTGSIGTPQRRGEMVL